MCAIAGIIGLNYDEETLQNILKTMERRGPDGSGTHCVPEAALLHTRLAIIDPQGGKQPMTLRWGGQDYTLVYNGELYNTQELRQELIAAGHQFAGHSDTEVVLHAYAEFGADCVHRFNGIFAFAVWEEKSRRLFLARDRMGVKPLFYKLHDGGLLFASEIKSILAYPTVEAEMDGEGVAEIILMGPGRTPGCGVFHGILELEPGCCGWYCQGKWQRERYWKLKDREHTQSFEDTVQQVRFLVVDAIQRQMVSDVPIGTFLSGGLDSSIITAVCAREKQKAGEQLDTFSVDYVGNDRFFVPGKFQPASDNSYIQIMQEALGTRHHWTVLSPEDLVGAGEEATIARDLPGMADVDFSLLAFCKEIRPRVKVALSGECADEIFGGYPWYRDPEVRSREGFPWAQNIRQRSALLHPDFAKQIDPEGYVASRYRQTLDECDILPGTSPEETRMKQMVNLNFRWFMQTLLDRKDRMSMFSGLEVRVPFCDYRIAEYLYGIPWKFKDYQGQEKGLLRCAVEGLLPEQVRLRKKSPYPKTYNPHYLELVEKRFRQVLENPQSPILQIVRKDRLEGLITEDYTWPWYGQLMKAPQTIAYMLQVNFWMSHYRVKLR